MSEKEKQQSSRKEKPTAFGLGITTEKPKFPAYAQINKRQDSFTQLNWVSSIPVTTKDLVESGLVYTGVGDSVRCFYCGGGLRNWEEGDNPIVEHARWYPTCPHIRLLKGQPFIQSVADGTLEDDGSSCTANGSAEKPEDTLQTDASLALLDMGISSADILRAVDVFRKQNDKNAKPYTGEDLLKIIFEMEENPHAFDKYMATPVNNDDKDDEEEIDDDLETLIMENERLKETSHCKVCTERLADIVFLPCGHINCCPLCSPVLEKCPICRQTISGRVKAHFAV